MLGLEELRVQALAAEFEDADDIVKFTVGPFTVTPNAPSVVPRTVVFSIDLRHPDTMQLRALSARVQPLCEQLAGRCQVRVERLVATDAIAFDSVIREQLHAAARRLGAAARDMPSLAGHDAGILAGKIPTGMLFIPCRAGITHHEDELATVEHMVLGAQVLADVLAEIAR